MAVKLKERPRQMLDFIEEYLEENGFPPTVREIGRAVGISSTSHVTYYLNQLEEREYIVREPSVSRGIRLVESEEEPEFAPTEEDVIGIPYMGYIVAGAPIGAEALAGDETVDLNRALFGRDTSQLFALTVRGNSMIDALIHDGDLVILHRQERVENGEMAAVWLDSRGETTLKRVYDEGQRVRLQPENPTMDPIYVPAEDVRVQGKVVMVIRDLEKRLQP